MRFMRPHHLLTIKAAPHLREIKILINKKAEKNQKNIDNVMFSAIT